MITDQYTVCWVDLNPTKGAEMNKTRPCVVLTPTDMNAAVKTIMIAPITNTARGGYPTRTKINVGKVSGWVCLDQIRTVDKTRLCDEEGTLNDVEIKDVKNIIKEMLVD